MFKTIKTIHKLYNPNHVTVHYYNKKTMIYHLYKYSILPLLVITVVTMILLLATAV